MMCGKLLKPPQTRWYFLIVQKFRFSLRNLSTKYSYHPWVAKVADKITVPGMQVCGFMPRTIRCPSAFREISSFKDSVQCNKYSLAWNFVKIKAFLEIKELRSLSSKAITTHRFGSFSFETSDTSFLVIVDSHITRLHFHTFRLHNK